jgi:hypothetical protein
MAAEPNQTVAMQASYPIRVPIAPGRLPDACVIDGAARTCGDDASPAERSLSTSPAWVGQPSTD